MDLEIKTEIKSVTVFPDRALVTIQGRVDLKAGSHNVIFKELPIYIDGESVRTRGRSEASVRLLGVDVFPEYFRETPAADVAELILQIESLEDKSRELDDEVEVQKAHEEFVAGLRQETDRFAQGLSRGRATVEDHRNLTNYLIEQDRLAKASIRKLEIDRRDLQLRLKKLKNELREKKSSRPRKRMTARVGIESDAEEILELELDYLVSRAGWNPIYDLRLQSEQSQSSVEMMAYAEISQETGQDWTNVELRVSTARPAISQRMPELKPWYIDTYMPPPSPAVIHSAPSTQPMMDAQDLDSIKFKASRKTAAEAESSRPRLREPVSAEVESSMPGDVGSQVTFRIQGLTDVPSDGSTHKRVITSYKMTPDLDYLAIPKHTSSVFRRVKMINESSTPLLPGKSNLFALDEYIGSTELEYVAKGGEIEMLFGVEDSIRVEREMVRRDVDKARLRDRRQIRLGFEIVIENLLVDGIELELQDQLPISKHEDIRVKIERTDPAPQEVSELNIMEWQLRIESGEERKVNFAYLVEHPRDIRMMGLDV